MIIEDQYEDYLPTAIKSSNLWQNQKNLASTSLYFESKQNEIAIYKESIKNLMDKIYVHELTQNCYDAHKINDIYNQIKLETSHKLNSLDKIICFKDDVGQGKSYAALALTFKKYSSIGEKLNIIIVPFKLVKQWENYIQKINIKSYFIINTTKNLNDYFLHVHNELILLISDTFLDKFYSEFFNRVTIIDHVPKYFLRCFVDEYDFIQSKRQDTIKKIFKYSTFKYILSSTISCTFPFFEIRNHDRFVNKCEFPIINRIIKTMSLAQLFDKISLDNERILKNYEVSNYETCNDLFMEILEDKDNKIKSFEKILKRYQENEQNQNNQAAYESNIQTLTDSIIKEKKNRDIVNRLILDECNVCLLDAETKIILLCCCNLVCKECFKQLRDCPYCRGEIKQKLSNKIDSKFQKLLALSFEPDSKIIIVGNECEIKKEKIDELSQKWFNHKNVLLLKGRTVICNNILEKFRTFDNYNILFFPNLDSVCGLNLEFATNLIVIGKLKDKELKQIMGRVQRFGRTVPLVFHYFTEIIST